MVAQACDLYNREAEAGKLSQVQSQNELQSWDSSYKKKTKDKEKVKKKGKHTHTILCVQYLGWGGTRIKEGEEGEKESKNAKLCLPFLAAASFLSFLNFSKARRMSTILLVSDCFFLTSDKTPSAAALSSCSWRGKSPQEPVSRTSSQYTTPAWRQTFRGSGHPQQTTESIFLFPRPGTLHYSVKDFIVWLMIQPWLLCLLWEWPCGTQAGPNWTPYLLTSASHWRDPPLQTDHTALSPF